MSESELNFETYPPIFRQLNRQTGQDADAVVDINQVSDSDPLPVIDLQCLNVDHLGEVCRDWGVFRLVNHGVPLALLSQLQDHTKKLFSLPFETKQALFTSPFTYFWGTAALTPSGAALPIGPQNINWVEGLNIPLGHDLSQLQPQLQAVDPVFASFRFFKECPHPDENQRCQLSRDLGLEAEQIKFWFQNKRTQTKAQTERAENERIQCENLCNQKSYSPGLIASRIPVLVPSHQKIQEL